jgi:hypothetical protein
MSRRLLTVFSGLLLATAACGHQAGGDVEPKVPPARVEVTNNYALPLEISVYGGGTLHRLGLVNPGMSSQFQIPPSLIRGGSVEFQANPSVSTQHYRSGELLLSPGSVVDLVIASVLFNSTATLRP